MKCDYRWTILTYNHLKLSSITCIPFSMVSAFTYEWIFLSVQFLRCREAWLTGILEDLDQKNAYEYLKGMINCHRMHLFDVVNQYRAIFADDTSGSEENYDGGLLFSWAMHQITSHLKTLKIMLPKITEGGSLSNILDQCMVEFFCISCIPLWIHCSTLMIDILPSFSCPLSTVRWGLVGLG